MTNMEMKITIKLSNISFERVEQVNYLQTTQTNQNCIHEQIKGLWNVGNACYPSVYNILTYRLLSKNKEIKIRLQRYNLVCCFVRV